MAELYVAWRSLDPARWYTVGRLVTSSDGYAFEYTQGFAAAHEQAGMRPIYGFPEPERYYISDGLFPLFTNRLMRPSRPDYAVFIAQLGLSNAPDPFDVLARSEGYRATDDFRVYLRPRPLPSPNGPRYRVTCFAAGFRFIEDGQRARAARLSPSEALRVVAEPNNPDDPYAHQLSTEDGHVIGYVPRYYAPDLTRLLDQNATVRASVRRNNIGEAPSHRALLCEIDAPWPDGFRALDTPEHQLLRTPSDSDASLAS